MSVESVLVGRLQVNVVWPLIVEHLILGFIQAKEALLQARSLNILLLHFMQILGRHLTLQLLLQQRLLVEHVLLHKVLERALLDLELPDDLQLEIIDHTVQLVLQRT